MLPGIAGASAFRFGVGADKKRTRESAQTLLILRRGQVSSLSPARHAVPLATSGIECCEGLVMKSVGVHGSSLQRLRHGHAGTPHGHPLDAPADVHLPAMAPPPPAAVRGALGAERRADDRHRQEGLTAGTVIPRAWASRPSRVIRAAPAAATLAKPPRGPYSSRSPSRRSQLAGGGQHRSVEQLRLGRRGSGDLLPSPSESLLQNETTCPLGGELHTPRRGSSPGGSDATRASLQ